MKIVVFIKEIPATNDIKIDPITHNLIRSNQPGRINPFDMYALETALDLKDRVGAHITVITMGPSSFKGSLYEAMAMGVDDAILISSRAFAGSDTLATAYTLSQAIRKIGGADLLLFGLRALDADTGQVAPLVAEELNIPHITSTTEVLNIDKDTIDVKRKRESTIETVRVSYPLVLSTFESKTKVRYMNPNEIKNISKKTITIYDEKDLECDLARIGMKGSPSQVLSTYSPDNKTRDLTLLKGSTEETVTELLNTLKERHLL